MTIQINRSEIHTSNTRGNAKSFATAMGSFMRLAISLTVFPLGVNGIRGATRRLLPLAEDETGNDLQHDLPTSKSPESLSHFSPESTTENDDESWVSYFSRRLLGRNLDGLTRDEVQALIFERHNEPYPEKNIGPTAAPGPPTPTVTFPPVLTAPPTASPVAGETVEQFLTRTLTDDGLLQLPGTPQNLAYLELIDQFPNLSPGTPDSDYLISVIYSLNTLYFATDGGQWLDSSNWLGPSEPCTITAPWFGISCDASQTVAVIALPSNDLVGELPSEIRGVSTLQTFVLSGNTLFGSLPSTVGELPLLSSLDANTNFLNETLPVEIGDAESLQELDLSQNDIPGVLPTEMGRLGNLTTLNLEGNQFFGVIPTELGLAVSLGKHT